MSVKRLIENEKAPRKVAAIRTDGAREFVVDSKFHRMCDEEGIAHQVSAPHSQYQNGRAERKIGVLMFRTKAMMIQSNAPQSDWGFALNYAVFLLNRTPSVRLQDHSPYELWHQRPFDFNPPAAFGNRVLAKVFIKRKGRLDHDAKPSLCFPGTL